MKKNWPKNSIPPLRENVKEAVESLSWDFNNTGIQVKWKAHQSANSSAQIQIFCCPSICENEGLTEELIYNMKMVEKKMCTKGQLPLELHDKPLPTMNISWRQNSLHLLQRRILLNMGMAAQIQPPCKTVKIQASGWRLVTLRYTQPGAGW